MVHGELANVRKAALPIIASLSGMVVPAIAYLLVSWGEHGAVFYTSHVDVLMLLLGAALLAAYALLPHQKLTLVPLGVAAWYAVEAGGVHATVVGVALGLLTRTTANAEAADHYFRPISAGLAVPVFAFLSAGVKLDGSSLGAILSDRVVLGVIAGLVLGKFGGAWLSVRLGLAKLSEELHWRDITAVSLLAGIGFTVSLLIGDLAYGDDRQRAEAVTTGVLAASVIASILAAVLLHVRVRKHRIALDDV
ncbi:Na+/H+ antiporter NhaA [Nonomuraea sp. B19D2]|uniref:Na+/H+ antiporter NhaA n=1 Tax=Nonomuraea sp. B19D2 TaxID=3159561 RepID=UPI0032DA7076